MENGMAGGASVGQRLGDLILTTDFRQRRRMSIVLTTAVLYAACLALFAYGIANGIFDAAGVRLTAVLIALTALLFIVVIRSGFNLRFAEPSLAFPQTIAAQTLLAMSYCTLGPVHAGTLVLLAMVMCFGMFDMSTRNVRIVVFYTIAVIGAAMAWCARTDPANYPPALEMFYFGIMCTALPAISSLSVQLSRIRAHLKTQKAELKEALAHIQRVATHDELTELPNRRHMIALLGEHITRHARGAPGFTVALADIDHFKNVNDTYGHRVGDQALVAFASQARAYLRSTDIIARWGGEEFLLLLPETTPAGEANAGIERLRAALAVTQASAQAPLLRIAFSTGMTRYIAGEQIDDMIERADRALYAAKAGGRNRTAVL